jgi:hypothetical protein
MMGIIPTLWRLPPKVLSQAQQSFVMRAADGLGIDFQ